MSYVYYVFVYVYTNVYTAMAAKSLVMLIPALPTRCIISYRFFIPSTEFMSNIKILCPAFLKSVSISA